MCQMNMFTYKPRSIYRNVRNTRSLFTLNVS